MKILFATTNKAKMKRYSEKLIEDGIELITLSDLNINIDVEENGIDAIENAVIKAKAYNNVCNMPTIAIDDVLYLNNVPLDVQPGPNVRRVNGKRLNDKEMIEYYTNLVKQYGKDGKLDGYFIKGIAIVNNEKIFTHEVRVPRCFLDTSSQQIDEGYPLASIQFIPELNKFKSELTKEEEENIVNSERDEISKFIIDKIKEF